MVQPLTEPEQKHLDRVIGRASELIQGGMPQGKAYRQANQENPKPWPGCTGYLDDEGRLLHDGDTCPIHEG